MKKLQLLLLLALMCNCEPEEEVETCNPATLAVTGSVLLNGEQICYQRGGLGFNDISNTISLILFSPRGTTGEEIDVQFSAPDRGINLNESYQVTTGEYNNDLPVTGGSITFSADNYPADPTLLYYSGTIDLTFQQPENGSRIEASGTFSFEKP